MIKKFVLLETGSNKIISPEILNSILIEEFQKSLTSSKGIKNILNFMPNPLIYLYLSSFLGQQLLILKLRNLLKKKFQLF